MLFTFSESWFTMDEKHPIAFAKVEIIEAFDIKPGDLSGKFRYVSLVICFFVF